MSRLIKREVLFDLALDVDDPDDLIRFVCDQDEGPSEVLLLNAHDWRDMGAPNRLTLTIEPDDQLNHG